MSPPTPESGGWFKVQDAAVARIASVGPLATSVYVVLAKHADLDGWCWPSFSRLATLCGATRRGVQKAVARLVHENMIVKEKRADSHGGLTSNRYRVLPLSPQEPVEPTGHRVVNQETLPYGTTVHQGGEPIDPRVVNQEHQELDPMNQTQEKAGKKPSFDPLKIDLPYRSERFLESWAGFVEHRQSRKRPLTSRSAELILAKCRAWGEAAAVEALDTAVENVWSGIFPPKSNAHSGNSRPKPDDRPIVYAN